MDLVAYQTREGQVFETLFEKLEEMRQALGGRVFDVLGRLFEGDDLRTLMMQAVLEGESDAARGWMQRVIEAVSREHIDLVLKQEALNVTVFGPGIVATLREQLQRAELQRLVPYYIASFFKAAFDDIGGAIFPREADRYEITRVPRDVQRLTERQSRPVARRYERVCFDKARVHVDRKPPDAQFIAPGHPLLDGTIEVLLERYGGLLIRGAILVDERAGAPATPRAMFAVRQDITDARPTPSGAPRRPSALPG